ncbi:head GIN domain-containing protein [Bacteroidota bacterium]
MKRILVYTTLLVISLMTSCYHIGPCVEGFGSLVEEVRDVNDFYSVSNTTSFDVYVTQSDSFAVIVNAQENLLPIIETYKSGGTLIVKTREISCIRSTSSVKVYVSLQEIEELHLTGSGMIVCDKVEGDIVELSITSSGRMMVDSVFCEDLNIRATGSGDFESLEIDADYTEVKITGSGQIDFGNMYADDLSVLHTSSGTVRGGIYGAYETDITMTGSGRTILIGDSEDLTTSNSGSGRIDALDLLAVDVRTHSTGSGNTYVNASGMLDVTILGSGDVIYLGDPDINSRITGSGNLRAY